MLHVPRRRRWCDSCGGPRLEKLNWLGRGHTAKSIDKALLMANTVRSQLNQIEQLAMYEFALHEGHRYATVVVDPISCLVLWVGQRRSRETARQFLEQLFLGVTQRIRAVDMTAAHELGIKANCPNAYIVYGLFHVVAKYGREVVDRVRVDRANLLRQQPSARKVLKSSSWLLLRNRNKLQSQQPLQLKELLAANQPLMTVYVLRDEFKTTSS